MPLSLREGLLCVLSATGIAANTKVVNGLLAAAIFALLVHRHLLQTLFNVHLIVLQELLKLARLSKNVRSADIVSHLCTLNVYRFRVLQLAQFLGR